MTRPFLPFHLPDIGEDEIQAASEVLRSGWLTTGPRTQSFEREFCSYIGASHAVALNSATAALHLALEAVGVKEGDEVIVPTMTFAATAEVVHYFRAVPVLVDCEPRTMNVDPAALERAITPRTRAAIPVHIAGHPCDMDPILSSCRGRAIHVIEDAAHAPPIRYKGRMVGTLGDITCFSFHAIKPIAVGEGGMAVTDSQDWADRMRVMGMHGISRDAWKRYSSEGSWRYEILEAGYKYNATDIASAIGSVQLRRCEEGHKARTAIAAAYDSAFQERPELEVPPVETYADQHSRHLYILRLNLERLRIDRDRFIEELRLMGIGTSVHYVPLHLHPYYRRGGLRESDLPNATLLSRRILSLPIYPRMSRDDVTRVIDAVLAVASGNGR